MSMDAPSDIERTERVKLTHPEIGDIGSGSLTYGYDCISQLRLDGMTPDLRLTAEQLSAGLLAVGEQGQRFSLFNCDQFPHSLFPDFVTNGELKIATVRRFEVRYTEISEWFFQQMTVGGILGKKLEWPRMPPPLFAEVSKPDHNFEIKSIYFGSLEQNGEDRNLHQHFEFRFTATRGLFTLPQVKDLAHQLSTLLSIILAHPVSIASVDVYTENLRCRRLYYLAPTRSRSGAKSDKEESGIVRFHNFFVFKSDLDPHWNGVVKKFFASELLPVVWSRLAGMQHHQGFWEQLVMGYMTILDGYVSKRYTSGGFMISKGKEKAFAERLASKRLGLRSEQQEALLKAAREVFGRGDNFDSKFQQLVKELDSDIYKIINLSDDDFISIKTLRDEFAHGNELSFTGKNLTPILVIVHRIELLLTYLFFLDVGLNKESFVRGLDNGHNKLRRGACIDEVHLARTLRRHCFLQMTPIALRDLRARPTSLLQCCVTRTSQNLAEYSEEFSRRFERNQKTRSGGKFHEILDLPEEAVAHLSEAYFECGSDLERVHSVVLIDLDRLEALTRTSG